MKISSALHAPSTTLRVVPPPPHCVRGRTSERVLATHMRPSCARHCEERSDEAIQPAPPTSRRLRQPNRPTGLLRFARNDERTKKPKQKRKRNADRRVDRTSALFRARRVPSGARRLSAFHRGSGVGDRTPSLSSRTALPGTWQRACPSPASSSQTGHSAGRAYCPKPPENEVYRSARGHRTRSTFRSTLGRRCPSLSEIRRTCMVPKMGTYVNENATDLWNFAMWLAPPATRLDVLS